MEIALVLLGAGMWGIWGALQARSEPHVRLIRILFRPTAPDLPSWPILLLGGIGIFLGFLGASEWRREIGSRSFAIAGGILILGFIVGGLIQRMVTRPARAN